MKSILKIILILSLQVAFVLSAKATNDLDLQSQSKAHLIMQLGEIAPDAEISITDFGPTDTKSVQNFLKDPKVKNADVLLSSDSAEVYTAVAKTIKKDEKSTDRKFKFIPIGVLASAQEKIASGFAVYKNNVKSTLMHDKFGLTVITITTASDCFVWLHSTTASIHQQSSMILLNLIVAATFGLDRDLWARMTIPLRHKVMNVLEKYGGKIIANKPTQTLVAGQFISNLTWSVGFQFFRQTLLSLDTLSAVLKTAPFWTKSILVGSLTTISSFGWGELSAAADKEKNPVAKNALRRFADMRNIILCQIASMGMILQPGAYGSKPIIAVAITSGLGLLALMNSNRVIQWLEKNKFANIIYKSQMRIETAINQFVQKLKSAILIGRKCEALFN